MMSRSSRPSSLQRWTIVAAALAVWGAAPAEMLDKAKPSAKTRPTPVESMARIADDTPKSTLKCWQEGRLIFESNGVSMPDGAAAAAIKGANGRTVHLLEMHQGLCILERSNG